MASLFGNLFPNLSQGIGQQMAGPKAIPTTNQVQSTKMASSLTTPNTSRPGATVTTPKVSTTATTPKNNYVAPTISTPPPAQTNVLNNSGVSSTGQNLPGTGGAATQPDYSNFQQNQQRAVQAAAPVDTAQYQPALNTLANANQQLALAQSARAGYSTQYDTTLTPGSQTTSDTYNRQLSLADRILGQQAANAGLAQTGAANTLTQQMAVSQANRTQGIEQAGVPLTLGKSDMQMPAGTSAYNPYNVQAGAQAGGYFGGGTTTGATGGAFNPSNPLDVQAQQLIQTGDFGSVPVQYQGQVMERAKQLQPNFNPATSKVAAKGYSDSYQGYQDLKTQYEGAQALGTKLNETASEFGINTTDPKFLNQTVNSLRSQFSDEGYQRFISTLYNTSSAYAAILATGGGTIPTEATNNLKAIIDPNSNLDTIKGAIDQLNQEVYGGKLLPLYNKVQGYSKSINIGGQGSTGSTGSSTKGTSVGWF